MPMSIDRRSNLTKAEFEAEYVSKSRPVLLTDAIDHWPARGKWNLDYFESKYADKRVRFDKKEWRLGDFIREIKAADGSTMPPYLKEVKLDEQFPELWEDVGEIDLAKGNRLKSRLLPRAMRIARGIVALFIGTKGSGFRKLHWDYSYLHVFISQVRGAKDAVLFHPDQTKHLYPNPEQDNQSLIPDPYVVDAQAFPEFAHAEPTFLTIAEGETLFIPANWWHATQINEPSIAIAESTLDAHNWEVRKNWYLDTYAKANAPAMKLMALSAYMNVLNALL